MNAATPYEYVTHRIEWVASVIYVDQYGNDLPYPPVWSEIFPSKALAEEALSKRATWSPALHRWRVGNDSYKEGRVTRKLVFVE